MSPQTYLLTMYVSHRSEWVKRRQFLPVWSVDHPHWWNPKCSPVHWVVGRTAIEREYCLLLLLIWSYPVELLYRPLNRKSKRVLPNNRNCREVDHTPVSHRDFHIVMSGMWKTIPVTAAWAESTTMVMGIVFRFSLVSSLSRECVSGQSLRGHP